MQEAQSNTGCASFHLRRLLQYVMLISHLKQLEQRLVDRAPGEHAPATLGVALIPLSGEVEPIMFNHDTVFPAASTIKTYLLFALLHEAQRGALDLGEEYTITEADQVGGSGVLKTLSADRPWTLLDIATLMIIVSDNTATNILFDRVGQGRLHELITEHGWSDSFMPRKLMLENPTPSPAGFPPMSETTPIDLATHFAQLWRGELLDAKHTAIAKRIYLQQQYLTLGRLIDYEGSNSNTNTFLIGSKTGSITGVRHDAGIFCLPAEPFEPLYAVAIMTKGCDDLRYVPDNRGGLIVSETSKVLFEWFRDRHGEW